MYFISFLIASITTLSRVAKHVSVAMLGEKILKKKVEHELMLEGELIKSRLLCGIAVLVWTT